MTQRLTLRLAFPLSELRKKCRPADLALPAFGDSLDDKLKSPKRRDIRTAAMPKIWKRSFARKARRWHQSRESKASLPSDDAALASRLSNLAISQVEFSCAHLAGKTGADGRFVAKPKTPDFELAFMRRLVKRFLDFARQSQDAVAYPEHRHAHTGD
jgi:hypothetical protein